MDGFDSDYFLVIDSKDKAYWLGLLFADGSIDKYMARFSFNLKDSWFLEKANRTFNKFSIYIDEKRKQYRITLNGVKIVKNLISHGCVPRKSKIIELPFLDSRELYLSFLLGFFDGDGTQKKTSITCGSIQFLEQIKKKFKLKFIIHKKESYGYIEGRPIHGIGFELCLGSKLFNEMMMNYSDSLPRKRKHFCSNNERIDIIKRNVWKGGRDLKLNVSKEELKDLVWKIPSTIIAKKYGVSDRLITKRCKQFGIEKPGRGYWSSQK